MYFPFRLRSYWLPQYFSNVNIIYDIIIIISERLSMTNKTKIMGTNKINKINDYIGKFLHAFYLEKYDVDEK